MVTALHATAVTAQYDSREDKPAPVPRSGVAESSPETLIECRITDPLPFGQAPINYESAETDNAIARLQHQLEQGKLQLTYEGENGYLRAVLDAFGVPIESQLLVFSKTARNHHIINPKQPRAIFFNDEVTVAWVPGSAALELTSVDPVKGGMFYTLSQSLPQDGESPHFLQDASCLACHVNSSTYQTPGFMNRSFLTDRRGKPLSGYSEIHDAVAFSKRWGGWYVTGSLGTDVHRGNLAGDEDNERFEQDPGYRARVTDLSTFFDTNEYLFGGASDVAAHLVFDHQMHVQNLLIRVGHEARLGRRSDAEERLLRALLFADEVPLNGPVESNAAYRTWFSKQGPRDEQGRSLREFDLHTRLFRYRLSYAIDSPLFDGLPEQIRERVLMRIYRVLAGEEDMPGVSQRPQEERLAIVQIVRATKCKLPACWSE